MHDYGLMCRQLLEMLEEVDGVWPKMKEVGDPDYIYNETSPVLVA